MPPSLTTFLSLLFYHQNHDKWLSQCEKRWMLDTAINRFKDKWTFFFTLLRDNNQFFPDTTFGYLMVQNINESVWEFFFLWVNCSIDLIYLIIEYWFQVSVWKSYGNKFYYKNMVKNWMSVFWRNAFQANGIFLFRLCARVYFCVSEWFFLRPSSFRAASLIEYFMFCAVNFIFYQRKK